MLTQTAHVDAGADVSVSPVMGKGFPVEKIPAEAHPTVLLFATGAYDIGGACTICTTGA
jgi:hypothetical protein